MRQRYTEPNDENHDFYGKFWVESKIHSIHVWPLTLCLPCYCFSQVFKSRRWNTKEKKMANLLHSTLHTQSFHALYKHMHFPLTVSDYFLNFFNIHSNRTLPLYPTQKATPFSFSDLFFQDFTNKQSRSQQGGWMEDRHHITHGNRWMDSAARCLKAENWISSLYFKYILKLKM